MKTLNSLNPKIEFNTVFIEKQNVYIHALYNQTKFMYVRE